MKKNKFLAISASVLALMSIGIPRVLAEEPVATVALEDSKSAEIKYNVDQVYEWNIHSGIDFGKNAGVNQSVSVKSNFVSVTKNVLEEGNKLVIKVKDSGDGNGFTISNGGKEKLSYSINDGTKDLGVNGTVLEVPAGTNEGTKNLEFKLKTADKKAEIAGIYNGVVTYTAEINGDNSEISGITSVTKLTIEGKEYTVIENVQGNQYKVLTSDTFEKPFDDNKSNNYANSTIATYLDNDYYNSLDANIKNAVVPISIQQKFASSIGDNNPTWTDEVREAGIHKVFIPSWDEVTKVYGTSHYKLKAYAPNVWTWIRDTIHSKEFSREFALSVDKDGRLTSNFHPTSDSRQVHPAMVLDLSKVTYTVK